MIHNSPGQGTRPPKAQDPFVESVEVREEKPRWLGTALVLFWTAILAKSAVIAWLVHHYDLKPGLVPWVVVPTLIFAGLATWLMVRRRV
jgi:hypothetical protein